MLSDVSQPQRERLFHIDFRANFRGQVSRQDLIARFGIREAAATRDLALYRALAPGNLEFDGSAKIYRRAEEFTPLFEHDPFRSLVAIAEGLGDAEVGDLSPHVRTEHPLRLNVPAVEIIATLTRAIVGGAAVRVVYHSLTSGRTVREIVPHALVDTAARWHVRAYDRRRLRFSDFVLTRIEDAESVSGATSPRERREADDQWMRMVELDLVPHPALARSEPVERDFGMTNGRLHVRLRAALCGYALVHWSVDASADHHMDPARHHLWLRNREALYGVENLGIAPGFDPGDATRSA
ncbi:WYL domain-containing protein (plasmid) [Cereibacter azotoformans]|uniref:Putative DNA-binding transcriptional regulator YafY n=1 Tax=Cereibacter azotoformans TaxID=43057 RepID=A0A2T5JQ00_9RHOB|nr:WYL domain-containing protein [Cereibacter azotoformans]AXQ96317.1 WYL domain-containing protein [Cereibacter sphaeroides]MBO4170778.1 WYL domain-containing protein [Cereibacter azotoformans]PTR09904.1 putative DNA-binding transcriptional regulator YafY [Cereibacter azotoformans]UIJ33315.1 WYL domain-containing protein [Cereibacter azotoformans]